MAKNRQLVFLFPEGDTTSLSPQARGGKGAVLAEMVRLGVPVPPGFTVTTTLARGARQAEGRLPKRLAWQLRRAITQLERETGKGFGNPANPLLVSVRSGAPASMPGMMDTVLNLGLNLRTVKGLAQQQGEVFAYDSYRRFLASFGEVVLGIERDYFDEILQDLKVEFKVKENQNLPLLALQKLVGLYRQIMEEHGYIPTDDPWLQLQLAIRAVLRSWDSERAKLYRQIHQIPNWWGTAVNIQAMVFGNHGPDSATGVVFSHDTATGDQGLCGEFLINAQGEDIVSGGRTPLPISKMAEWNSAIYDELNQLVQKLARHYDNIVEVEFTVEQGTLFILQGRIAKRTAEAAVTFAVHQVWQGAWTKGHALSQVSSEQIEQVRVSTTFDPLKWQYAREGMIELLLIARGLPASPGVAVGYAAFTTREAIRLAQSGENAILCRPDTSPSDLDGMMAAEGIITAAGGITCHAAVVARGLGKPAITSADFVTAGIGFQEGEILSLNGTTGEVIRGEIPIIRHQRKKEVNIFLRWWANRARKNRAVPPPRLGLEWLERKTDINQLLNDYYLTEVMASQAAGTRLEAAALNLRDAIHQPAAELLACYLTVAVAGELRHGFNGKDNPELEALEKEFRIFPDNDRLGVQTTVVNQLRGVRREKQIRFFQLATRAFSKENFWSSSVGGPRWADIAKAGMLFLEGKLNHSLFVDHVFDLRHNGGVLFDKSRMVDAKQYILEEQLENKRKTTNPVSLYLKLNHAYPHFSPEVSDLWTQGREMNIWGKKAA